MPDDIRIKKIEAYFTHEISRIVMKELKNPIFGNRVISVVDIKVSRDLSTARVWVSVLGNNSEAEEIVKALNEAEPLIRHEIMSISDLRRIPVFTFLEDHTMENAARIDSILDSLYIPPEEEPGSPEDAEDLPEEPY